MTCTKPPLFGAGQCDDYMQRYEAFCEEIDALEPRLLGTAVAHVMKHGRRIESPFSPEL